MTADTPPDPGERFTRKPRGPRADENLETPPREAFDAELDAITARVSRVATAGRAAFVDGSASYDVASMAIIRLAGVFEVRRFGPFLLDVTSVEQRSIKATRQYAAHGGYRVMDDEEFWHTVTVDVPELIGRLRSPS